MPTVIDSLVVTLGLDPKNFTAGQKAALAAFKKTQEEARKSATAFEESSQRIINGFSRARNEVIGLFGAAAGAYGVKQFVSNMVTGDAALGRFARTTGIAAEDAAKFGKAIELAGGEADAGKQALANLNNQVQAFRSGKDPGILKVYNQLAIEGGHVIDLNKTIIEQFKTIAANARVIEARTPGRGGMFLRDLGINEDTINVIIRGDEYLGNILDKAEKLNNITKRGTDLAESLLEKYRAIGQAIQGATREPELVVGEAFDKFLDRRIIEEKRSPEDRQADANKKIDNMLARVRSLFGSDPLINRMFSGSSSSKGGPSITPTESPWMNIGASTPVGKYFGGAFGDKNFKPMGWDSGEYDRKTEINVSGPITINAPEATGTAIRESLKSGIESLAEKRRNAIPFNAGQE